MSFLTSVLTGARTPDEHVTLIMRAGFKKKQEFMHSRSEKGADAFQPHTKKMATKRLFGYFSGPSEDQMVERKDTFSAFVQENLAGMTDYQSLLLDYEHLYQWRANIEEASKIPAELLADPGVILKRVDNGGNDRISKKKKLRALITPEAAELVNGLYRELKVITKLEFEDSLIVMAHEIVRYAKDVHASGKKVILSVDRSLRKSHVWVAIQVWGVIKDHVDGLTDVYLDNIRDSAEWGNAHVLVLDDAGYSGQQMQETLHGMRRDGPTLTIVPCVPYASSAAVQMWAHNPGVHVLLPAHPKMLNLRELGIVLPEKKDILGHEIVYRHIPLMFSHKLPDLISIPNFVFAIAPHVSWDLETKTVTLWHRSLVTTCDASIYKYRDMGKDDNDFIQVCPIPIYKQRAYLFEGRELPANSHLISDVFESTKRQRLAAAQLLAAHENDVEAAARAFARIHFGM